MAQDPQTTIFAVQRKSNEGFLIVSEYVTTPLGEKTLQTPLRDTFKDFIKVRVRAADKSTLIGKKMGVQDYALHSTFTAVKESVSKDSLGNEKMIPVIAFLKDAEVGDAGKIIEAGYYEAIIDATLTHDSTTEMYHLWYYINAWTSTDGSNTLNSDDSLLPLASRQYDSTKAAAFNPSDWWVVPQRNLKVSELKNAARVLLHAVGTKFHLAEGEADAGNWLVTREPEVVAYWPFGETAPGGMSFRDPVAKRTGVDYTPRNLNLPEQPIFKPLSTSGPRFNGVINFICDIEFFLTPCCIAKFPGKLIVENGEICVGSGCSCSSVSSGDCP